MQVTCRFFGPLREAAGGETISREVEEGTTLADLLAALESDHPSLESYLVDDNGELSDDIAITRNGRHIQFIDGPATELADGDLIRLTPPVKGG